MILGDTEEDLRGAIDRIEGRAPAENPIVSEDQTYGEVYGVLGTDLLTKILGREQPELAKRLQDAVQNVELHVSATGDVGMVAEVGGGDADKVDDLARSMGAALSLARLQAQAQGEHDLAELLDLARVSPQGKRFNLELALPMAFLEKHLAFCRQPWSPDAETPAPAP
jgi:hypothetical protein